MGFNMRHTRPLVAFSRFFFARKALFLLLAFKVWVCFFSLFLFFATEGCFPVSMSLFRWRATPE